MGRVFFAIWSLFISQAFEGAVGDVVTVEGVLEGDGVDAFVGFVDGGADVVGFGDDAEDAAAVGDDLAVFFGGAGVEDEGVEGFCFGEAFDRVAFFIGFGVAAGGDDDADGCACVLPRGGRRCRRA